MQPIKEIPFLMAWLWVFLESSLVSFYRSR